MSFYRPSYISLATKNAIAYFLLALAGLATLSFLLFQNSAKEIVVSSEQQVSHAGDLVDVKFAAFLDNVQRDISYLAHSPYLKDYLQNLGNKDQSFKKELLASAYLAMLDSKPDYSQIRLIGIDGNGKEIIRAERLEGHTFLVQGESLQEKGSRNYFYETIRLPEDSIFFSPIDLNKEYGQLSNPAIPTLRAACPVYMDGKPFGIIVINADLRHFFKELTTLVSANFDLKVVDMNGHFLIHPDSSKVFTFEYDRPPLFKADFGVSIPEMDSLIQQQHNSILKENGLLYAFRPISYPRKGYRLYVGVGAGEKKLLQSFYAWRKKSLLITAALGLLILFLAFWYMRRQARELKNITQTLTSFPSNMAPAKLPITRNDEIGQLAQSFERMSTIISNNLSALKKANKEVEQAIREKDAFLENMSHEIRNPIHSIMGMTHLLEKNNPGRHQRAFIEALKFNSKNLLSLVNDILDFKKLSTGDISIHNEWFALPPLIEDIASSHRFSAVSNKIKLEMEIDPELNQHLVYTDPNRLTQVVNNLVINAIKFTEENGQVMIQVSVLEKKKTELAIRFSIKDNGIGISEDQLAKITERNYTNKAVKNQGIPEGAGLGLPIVIQLLKMFSSTLSIDSAPGVGSHFFFDLTIPRKSQKTLQSGALSGVPIQLLEKLDVLVIDDDTQILFLYEHLFTNCTNSFTKVSNLPDLQSLPSAGYDLIISDIYFGKKEISSMDGELVTRLRPNGLMYFVSGIGLDNEKTAKLPPVKKLFQKPIDPMYLLNTVASDLAAQQFGQPDTSSILHDYDHDQTKFQRAINLLIDEWEKMSSQIEIALLSNDADKFIALRHKLITTVRRLQLDHFEAVLEKLFSEEQPVGDLPRIAAEIKQMMGFYIWYLKKETQWDGKAPPISDGLERRNTFH